jgi:putative ABC transport system permease protein
MLGFPIGLFGGFLSSKYVTEVPSDISLKVFLVAFLFSTLIGVVFGYSPAKRASSLTPVEALMQ